MNGKVDRRVDGRMDGGWIDRHKQIGGKKATKRKVPYAF